MIIIENVSKAYYLPGKRSIQALKDINLHIAKGEFVSIVGPSGSGKSTLLALAGLLDRQTSGTISFAGTCTTSLKDKDRTDLRYQLSSFIFQFSSLMPALSALDNVMLPLLLRGQKKKLLQERARGLLMKVGLDADQESHYPYQLSGGEQRRVAVARALLKEPKYLFADEPTSALDESTARDIIDLFHQLHKNGTTVMMVTHDEKLAREGTRIVKVKNGQLV